jgi:hypothetical protein
MKSRSAQILIQASKRAVSQKSTVKFDKRLELQASFCKHSWSRPLETLTLHSRTARGGGWVGFQSRAQGVGYANVAACRFKWRALQGMKPGATGAIYVKAICQRDEGWFQTLAEILTYVPRVNSHASHVNWFCVAIVPIHDRKKVVPHNVMKNSYRTVDPMTLP